MNWLRRRGPFAARYYPAEMAAFRRARLRLTAWYVLTLAVIVAAFSLALYAALGTQLTEHGQHGQNVGGDQQQGENQDSQIERDTADFALSRLRILLLAGNVILLLGGAGGAYLLSGKTLQPIASSLERQRRFTADASHELRTPLTVMRGAIDVVLQRERSSEEYRDVLEDLGEEVDTMTGIVERLLYLARNERQQSLAVCDVRAILEDVVRGTADLAASRGSTVSLALGEPLVTKADRIGLRQAFLNLVRNAIQHTPPGATIGVAGERTGDVIEITISDNGPGIPAAERSNIFQPFYRLQTTDRGGTGLGLALVHELVTAHRGRISVEETAGGGGATFRIRLPAIAPQR